MRLSPRSKLVSIMTIGGLLVGGLGIAFLGFVSIVKGADKTLQGLQYKIRQLEYEGEESQAVSRLMRQYQGETEKFDRFFVDAGRPLEFIEAIEELGRVSGVSAVLDLIQTEVVPSLKFRISLQGPQASLLRYVYLLENLPYFVEVDEFEFQTTGGGPAGSNARLGILIRVTARSL